MRAKTPTSCATWAAIGECQSTWLHARPVPGDVQDVPVGDVPGRAGGPQSGAAAAQRATSPSRSNATTSPARREVRVDVRGLPRSTASTNRSASFAAGGGGRRARLRQPIWTHRRRGRRPRPRPRPRRHCTAVLCQDALLECLPLPIGQAFRLSCMRSHADAAPVSHVRRCRRHRALLRSVGPHHRRLPHLGRVGCDPQGGLERWHRVGALSGASLTLPLALPPHPRPHPRPCPRPHPRPHPHPHPHAHSGGRWRAGGTHVVDGVVQGRCLKTRLCSRSAARLHSCSAASRWSTPSRCRSPGPGPEPEPDAARRADAFALEQTIPSQVLVCSECAAHHFGSGGGCCRPRRPR